MDIYIDTGLSGVATSPGSTNGLRDGLLGLYALTQMARSGPVHGYLLSERIAERTEGAWRPGPGAIYPALNRLARRGLAQSRVVGRRRVFTITPRGRKALQGLRAGNVFGPPRAPDLSVLWAEVWGMDDAGAFLLLRLRRSLDAIDAALASQAPSAAQSPGLRSLRGDVVKELSSRIEQLHRPEGRTPLLFGNAGEG